MSDSRPTLSVLIVTYNHERYIEEAVRGALDQVTSFPVEIVVGDDCSTDRTREILLRLKETYPDRIRLALHERNLGLSGRNNFFESFRLCRGEYVAILEGDDYWTDPEKLQRQVTYLQQCPTTAACGHRVSIFEQGEGRTVSVFPPAYRAEGLYGFQDAATWGIAKLLSLVLKRSLLEEWETWQTPQSQNEYSLRVFLSLRGGVYLFDRNMGTYRVHATGIWTGTSELARVRWHKETCLDLLRAVPHEKVFFGRGVIESAKRELELLWERQEHRAARIEVLNGLKKMPWAWLSSPRLVLYSIRALIPRTGPLVRWVHRQ